MRPWEGHGTRDTDTGWDTDTRHETRDGKRDTRHWARDTGHITGDRGQETQDTVYER